MKHFFRFASLLLLAALTSIGVMAQGRTRPTPVTQSTFTVGEDCYLYNVGRGMFANKGEAWGSQSTLGYTGMKYQIKHDDDMPEGYYYLYSDESPNQNQKVMFRTNDSKAGAGDAAVFVDNNKGDNAYWTITSYNGGFLIQIPSDTKGRFPFDETKAWGAQWDHVGNFFNDQGYTNGIFFDVVIANNPDNVTWQIVSVDDYEAYQDGLDEEAVAAYNAANDLKEWIDMAKQRGADVSAAEALYNDNTALSTDLRTALADLKPYVELQKAALRLKAAIDEAAAKGVDTSEAQAVYDNLDSTIAQMNAAIEKLNEAIADAEINNASYDHPADATSKYITNPQPNQGNSSGWTVLDANGNSTSIGSSSDNIGEFWGGSTGGSSISYTIKDLPAGAYVLVVEGWARTGEVATLQAGDEQMNLATIGSGDVNGRAAGRSWINAGKGLVNYLPFAQTEDGDLTIKLTSSTGGDCWTCWGYFKLMYYGNAGSDYKILAETYADGWEEEFDGSDYINGNSYYTAVSEIMEHNKTNTTKAGAIDDFTNVKQALADLRTNVQLWKDLDKLIYGNQTTTGIYDQQYNLALDGWPDEDTYRSLIDELAEKLDDAILDLSNIGWDNEVLQAKWDQINQLHEDALDWNASHALNVGDDLTDKTKFGEKFLKNPDFQSEKGYLDGWTNQSQKTPTFFNDYPDVLECWDGNFNISQEVKLPKDGAYRLQTRAFYRTGNTDVAYPRWNAANGENVGDNKSCAFLYAGNLTSPIANIYNNIYTREEVEAIGAFYDVERLKTGRNGGQFTTSNNLNPWEFPYDFVEIDADNGLYSPNGVFSASYIFNCYKGFDKNSALEDIALKYTSYIDFIGEQNEVVRMGVKAENILGQGWTIFAPYHLYYKGDDPAVMRPVMDETINLAKDLASEPMMAEVKEALNQAINDADGAATGPELMAAYKAINAAFGPAEKSANVYKTLADAKKDLEQTLADRADKASEEAKDDANTEISLVEAMLKDGTIDDADVPEEIENIKAVKRELFRPIPGVYPADYTEFALKNPKFQEDWTGWEHSDNTSIEKQDVLINGNTENWGIAEGWNNQEFSFDINQTITDLPEGVWEVRAQGLARLSDNNTNKALGFFTQDPAEIEALYEQYADSIAVLYANDDAVFLANPYLVPEGDNNQEIMKDNNGGDTGFLEMVDETDPDDPISYYYPNTRHAFASRLGVDWYDVYDKVDPEGKWYENVVVTYVDDSGVLKLGWKCDNCKVNAWAPATNFRIIYYGPDDPRKENTGIREITATQPVERTIFSADGRRMNGLNKGLNIIKTKTADGKTVIRKVVVK